MKINKKCFLKNLKISSYILIFDSGIGGLSIYDDIVKIFPNMNYIYFVDNDYFPYGEKQSNIIIQRVIDLLNYIYKKHNLLIVIIACNTVSTIGLKILRKKFHFPIIGVFPNIPLATKLTNNGIIGIIATNLTISGNYIQKIVNKLSTYYEIKTISSPELVELAEKKVYKKKIDKSVILNTLKPWTQIKKRPDIIVLGCTHYNFLYQEIKKEFFNKILLLNSNLVVLKKIFCIFDKIKKKNFYKKKNLVYYTKFFYQKDIFLSLFKERGFEIFKKISF
ncbi:MAG: glutamate racemase [Arsenophonus sp.]|nr:MAG: glutamate racemase [Arsenophonus sp.]